MICLAEYQLEYCADSVEWCPTFPFHHLFVCACYELKDGNRLGCINIFSFVNSQLNLEQSIPTGAGVLDTKWAPHAPGGFPLLAAALSNGYLQLYKLEENELKCMSKLEVCNGGMVLAVDWSMGVDSRLPPMIVVSCTDGCVHLTQLTGDTLTVLKSFKAHDYEAWTSAFNYWDTNIIYTGGDDCKLSVYDVRSNGTKPIHCDLSHSVGVTCIRSSHHFEGFLASASYEDVRIWKWSQNKLECKDKEDMSGGSWRVKWNPENKIDCKLAIAAMHSGFTILQLSEPTIPSDPELSGNFNKKSRLEYKGPHSSLGYGIDWSHQETNTLALCSFYDKKLSVAQLK